MLIGSTVPAHSLQSFQTRRASFKLRKSRLNPSAPSCFNSVAAAVSVPSATTTHKHLSNLDKLLDKSDHTPIDSKPVFDDKSLNSKTPPPEQIKRKGFLENLNFSRIWTNTSEEVVSPPELHRFRRLLSKSAEYSPRNTLGSRWRQYHGSNDWAGLLDPLDENLRREMVRYGEFIQAAYHCFNSDPATSADEAPAPRHVSLSDKSYRVTKNLYATSSVGLPKWIDKAAPDLNWMTQRSSCIGYVAVCDDMREIGRMGRRDIVIALRGTATCLEWAENMRDLLVEMPGEDDKVKGQSIAKVECGFLSLFKTSGPHTESLANSVVTEIQRLIEMYKGENLSITVTGHSLGAAMALLVADELATSVSYLPPTAVFSFGGPRVGNRGFANRLESKNVKVLRIVNAQDVITKVPGMFVSEELDKKLRASSACSVLNILDNNMPWAYTHVGTELRLDTKMSPFLKPDADVACCHDLEAYLHLVDGFMASNCPFRADAKRSLAKLLNEQNSNVKRLYVSKVKALTLNPRKELLRMPSVLPSPSSS